MKVQIIESPAQKNTTPQVGDVFRATWSDENAPALLVRIPDHEGRGSQSCPVDAEEDDSIYGTLLAPTFLASVGEVLPIEPDNVTEVVGRFNSEGKLVIPEPSKPNYRLPEVGEFWRHRASSFVLIRIDDYSGRKALGCAEHSSNKRFYSVNVDTGTATWTLRPTPNPSGDFNCQVLVPCGVTEDGTIQLRPE